MKKLDDSKYLEEIRKYRGEKEQAMHSFTKATIILKNTIHKLNTQFDDDLTFQQLSSFPLNEWVEVNGDQKTKKTYEDNNVIRFTSLMSKGSYVTRHHHSDCEEILFINKGIMFDLANETEHYEGESVTYKKGDHHTISAITDLNLIATIKKQ